MSARILPFPSQSYPALRSNVSTGGRPLTEALLTEAFDRLYPAEEARLNRIREARRTIAFAERLRFEARMTSERLAELRREALRSIMQDEAQWLDRLFTNSPEPPRGA